MLRALTAWLAPASSSRDSSTSQSCGDDDDRFTTRLFTFHHHTTQAPIPTPAYNHNHNKKRPSFDDGPMPYPAGHESPIARAVRGKSPSHGARVDVTDEELEEAMAQFAEISLPSMPHACSMGDDGPHLSSTTMATKKEETKVQVQVEKEEVLPLRPKCWCRLPTDAKEARMRDNDPLNPSRAYWTCANVGGTCNFFQWVEIIPPSKRTTRSSSSSSSYLSSAAASLLSSSTSTSASSSKAAAKDNDYLAGSSTATSAAALSSSLASTAPTSIFIASSAPKPYRSSAPIPIPQAAGAAANGRRRTPAKSAQEGADDSSC
jgi:hypothetical protein